MKDLMKKAISFVAFDITVDKETLRTKFAGVHTKQREKFEGWTTSGTQAYITTQYWRKDVAWHFACIIILSATIVFIFSGYQEPDSFMLALFSIGPFVYLLLYLLPYRYIFSFAFSPAVQSAKNLYEPIKTKEPTLAKQAQFSTFTLVLICYVFDKSSKMNALQCNRKFAIQLTKVFGLSLKGVSTALKFIYVMDKGVKPRKITEVRQDFENAYSFFEEMNFAEATAILLALEQKILDRYHFLSQTV